MLSLECFLPFFRQNNIHGCTQQFTSSVTSTTYFFVYLLNRWNHYTTFTGDGDNKSFQRVCEMDPYDEVTSSIHKEEFLVHVSNQLKNTLCERKKTHNLKPIFNKILTKPKAEYI